MNKLMLIQKLRSNWLYVMGGLAFTIALSGLTGGGIAQAVGLQPTYKIEQNIQITATGGFIDDPEASIPMFREISKGKWEFQQRDDDYQKTYWKESDPPEIYFKYATSKLYITHTWFATPLGGVTTRDKNGNTLSCDVAIEVNPTSNTGGSFVGVLRDSVTKNADCTKAVQDQMTLGSNQVTFGNISQPIGEQFLGVTIETCKQRPGTHEYGLCVARRSKQIKEAANALHCDTNSESGLSRCNYYKSILTCLEKDPANTVSRCTSLADATNILNGNLSVITVDTTDEYINQLCSVFSNKDQRQQCIDKATKERDRLQGAKEKCEKSGGTWNNSTGECTPAESTTSCGVEGVGWIICPLLSFMGTLNDAAFGFISDFLTIEPKLLTDNDTRAAWSNFRDIANVAFVIAFLIIVYSQITGTGVSNYGIKRMLPRLFIAAVLVNLSYFVCQIAVDLSNILGSSIYSFFKDMPTTDALTTTTSWKDNIGFVLALGAAVVVGLLALSVISTAALLAFALIILILVARKAALILLVVVSPLAFVAYLLPNTEKWFKKWWKMFSSLLLVFPVVGVIFGASTLAARIINNAGGDPNESNYMLQITALGVMAIPLFAVPIVLKSALSAAGSIGTKLNGMADRAQKGAGTKAKERFDKSALGQYKKYRSGEQDKRRALIQSGVYSGKGGRWNPRNLRSGMMGRVNNANLPGSAGKFGDRLAASGSELENKMWDEEVARQSTLITVGKNLSNDEILGQLAAGTGSAEYQAALGSVIMKRNHRESHLKAVEITRKRNEQATASGDEEGTRVVMGIQKQMLADGGKNMPWAVGDQAMGALEEGKFGAANSYGYGVDLREQMADRVGKKLSVEKLVSLNPDELKSIYLMAKRGELSSTQLTTLQSKIAELRSDPQYKGQEKTEATAFLNDIASNTYTPGLIKDESRVF